MRTSSLVALVLALALLGAAAWFLGGGAGPDEPAGEREPERSAEEPPAAPPTLEASARPRADDPATEPAPAPPAEPAPPASGPAALRVQVSGPGDVPPSVPVRVTVTDAAGSVRAAEMAADGIATFPDLAPGLARIDALAPGHTLAWVSEPTLEAGKTTDAHLNLEPGASVVGRVVAARDGRPVPGAVVDVRGGGALSGTSTTGGRPSYGVVRTDADGRFATPGLPFDHVVTVVVRAPGFRRLEKAMRLQPVAGDRPALELRLEPGGTVRGAVVGPDGSPAAGALVVLAPAGREGLLAASDENTFPEEGVESAHRATADAAGLYVLDGIGLDEEYLAAAFAAGHAPSRRAEGIRLVDGRAEARVDLALRRLATLTVRVRGPAGEVPRSGSARIASSTVELDAGGAATFPGLVPGDHEVEVRVTGFAIARERVAVGDGEATDRTIRLQAGHAVAGVVVDDLGAPRPSVSVSVLRGPDEREEAGSAVSGADGRFRVEGLPAGDVVLHVDLDDTEVHVPVAVPGPDARVAVPRPARVTARFTLPGRAKPPEQILVFDYSLQGSGGGGSQPWADGRVSWDVPAGPRVLRAQVDGVAPWERKVVTAPGETLDLGDVALDRGHELAGRVVDAAGRPVAGALLEPDAVLGGRAQSDLEGRFRLEHLPRGPLELTVEADGFVPMETALDVVRDESSLVLRLSRGARLVVTVVDATGVPAPGVPVHVHDPGAPRPELRGLWAWTETDGRGRAVARLLPGRYRVDLPRGKHVLATAEVALEEEKESTVELRLPAR